MWSTLHNTQPGNAVMLTSLLEDVFCLLLLGVFSRAPLVAVAAPLPLGVLVGSDWYW